MEILQRLPKAPECKVRESNEKQNCKTCRIFLTLKRFMTKILQKVHFLNIIMLQSFVVFPSLPEQKIDDNGDAGRKQENLFWHLVPPPLPACLFEQHEI